MTTTRIGDTILEIKIVKSICNTDPSILAQLDTDYFTSPAIKEIFIRLKALNENGKTIPSASVLACDQSLGEEARAVLADDNNILTKDKDIKAGIELLRKFRNKRMLIEIFVKGTEELQQPNANLAHMVTVLENALQKLQANSSIQDEIKHYTYEDRELLLEEAKIRLMEDSSKDFIPSGFAEFDRRTGGFKRNNVLVIASVPGGGKSAMALQMAVIQYMLGFKVCIVSYEMDVDEIESRLYSNVSKVEHGEISLRRLSKGKKELVLTRYREWLEASTIGNRLSIWTPRRELNINQIALELKPRNYDIIYIDYLSLLYQNPKKQLWENLGEHTRNAKLAAGSLNSAWVLLAQFDDKENKIKYSKAVEANANFIWAWDYGDKEKETGIIEVKQLKARNSSTYPFYLETDYSIFSFKDYMGPIPAYGNEDDTDKVEIKRRKKKLENKAISQKMQNNTQTQNTQSIQNTTVVVPMRQVKQEVKEESTQEEVKPKRGIPKMPQLF